MVPPRQCTDCHVNNNYNITVTTCISCHQTDFNNATAPVPHTGFPTTCQQCHDTVLWTDATFDHSTTGFILTGLHTVPPRACTDCHVNNNYTLNTGACVSCHLKDFQGTTNPNHVTANFPQTCEQCHDTTNWLNATFNHASTGFPLTGLHTVPPRACTDCHVNNNYSLNSTACITCHLKDYQGTTNPNHVTANVPQTCDQCHSTSTWLNATFNHDSTGFPLTGLHTVPPRACTDCHVSNNYSLSSAACVTCHLKDYQGTTNPNHVTSNFPQTCDQCHTTSTWLNATFDHSTTGFPLTGNHMVPPRACTDCHVNNNYNLTSTACVTCHQTDYNNATTPVNHVAAAFPTTCETCHDTNLWTDATFNHTTTGFQLTGAHTVPPRACVDCHVNGNYSLNSTLCYTCHQKDYTGTTSPAHATAGFPTTCELCHDTTVWTDSTFNHNNTAFPLTGSHTVPPRACTDCHVNGNYTTLPTTCIGCHQTDYNNTTNPGHAAQPQFFPTTCTTCHTTTAWTGATFNHTQYTQFSINHGNANGVCATCHTNSNDYSIFQCTACHGGNNAANFHHDNVNGYVYNSINCYQCHASGGGG
jgi:predicted CXXCH cytochrome family protein